jgi:hypothetical protein
MKKTSRLRRIYPLLLLAFLSGTLSLRVGSLKEHLVSLKRFSEFGLQVVEATEKIFQHQGIEWPFSFFFLVYFFGGLECVGHSFAYVAHL